MAWGVGLGRPATAVAEAGAPWTLLSQRLPETSASPARDAANSHLGAAATRALPARLPLAFAAVEGAEAGDPGFVARGPGYTILIGAAGAALAVPLPQVPAANAAEDEPSGRSFRRPAAAAPTVHRSLRVLFEGARTDVTGVAEAPLPGRLHRLIGRDARQWRTDLSAYARVRYPGIYPGVDVAFYGNQRELEYDLIVAPGASPDVVRLRFDGVRAVDLAADGQLNLTSAQGSWVQRRPVAYQEGPAGRETVTVGYRVAEDGRVGFVLGAYDARRALVIDPVLSYATLIGGLGEDQCWDLAVDGEGSAYLVGETESASFVGTRLLSTNAFQSVFQGGIAGAAGDAFVAKLSPDGQAFQWFTYFGGSDFDAAFTIALGAGGEPVIGGFTTSPNFPVTTGAFQSELRGATNRFTGRKPLEGFVARLKADGSALVASTLVGGDEADQVLALALLDDVNVWVGGNTTSTNFPVTAGAWQATNGGGIDGFAAVLRLTAEGSSEVFGSYLGGSDQDSVEGVAVEAGAAAHLTGITLSTNFPVKSAWQGFNAGGADAFVVSATVADPAAPALKYATYLGGEGNDYGYRLTPGPAGTAWVVGETASLAFPVSQALQTTNAGFSDGFLTRFSADGQALLSSTYFGGESSDALWSVAADAAGTIHVAGLSSSASLPGLTTNAVQPANAGLSDVLVARISADGQTASTTFYGAAGEERAYGIAVDTAGNTYVAGKARSVAFPVSSTNVAQATFGGGLSDGFVLKLVNEPALSVALRADLVEVTWPAPNAGFVLETRSAGAPQGAWTASTAATRTEAGRHRVEFPLSATNEVFRLRWSP